MQATQYALQALGQQISPSLGKIFKGGYSASTEALRDELLLVDKVYYGMVEGKMGIDARVAGYYEEVCEMLYTKQKEERV